MAWRSGSSRPKAERRELAPLAAWVETKYAGGSDTRWYSLTLWHCMTLPAWWRLLRTHGFRVSPSRLATAASVTLAALGNLPLALLQSALYGRRLRAVQIERDPIFILGHWRSGTTHLHELFALDERLACPTVFECAVPQHCLLTGRIYPRVFGWLLPPKRVMDDMAVGYGHPQEDELALVALGAPSPYWSFAYPGETAGQAYLSLRELAAPERARWERLFRGLLRLLTYRHGGKRLVLKSPPHTARLALLAGMFPDARFIHIVRDPYTVFASTVHLWRRAGGANALVRAAASGIEEHVLQSFRNLYRGFATASAALAAGRLHQLHYEDLVRDPLGTLRQCYAALDLGDFAAAEPRLREYLAGLRGYRTNEYTISPQARAAVRDAWSAIFAGWGYPS